MVAAIIEICAKVLIEVWILLEMEIVATTKLTSQHLYQSEAQRANVNLMPAMLPK